MSPVNYFDSDSGPNNNLKKSHTHTPIDKYGHLQNVSRRIHLGVMGLKQASNKKKGKYFLIYHFSNISLQDISPHE